MVAVGEVLSVERIPTRVHDLKVWPENFDALVSGSKPYEVRRDDRDFQVGDSLLLREWRPLDGLAALFDDGYTGRVVKATITHLTRGPIQFGDGPVLLASGVVVLGISVEEVLELVAPNPAKSLSCPNWPGCSGTVVGHGQHAPHCTVHCPFGPEVR